MGLELSAEAMSKVGGHSEYEDALADTHQALRSQNFALRSNI